jgi:hypothetical protein
MNEIQDTLIALLPLKRKQTPSQWTSFNAVCCSHRGESADTRQRGGLHLTSAGGWTYNCFNCNFKAGWSPGKSLSNNSKMLFKWLGLSDTEIGKLNLVAMKLKDDKPLARSDLNFTLLEKPLPPNTKSINSWIIEDQPTDPDLIAVIEYVSNRGFEWDWYDWHWCPENGYRDRIIMPFYHHGVIVGWTGRKIVDGRPKYLTDTQPGYVFNMDHQTYDRRYTIVVEGQFDAIAVDGVAIMHNEPNETQCARINALSKQVIVVPDRDRPGAKLVDAAIANNWTVSLPPWGDHIKDVADAVKQYGRLYTLSSILHYVEHNEIKIQLLKKKLESIKHDN